MPFIAPNELHFRTATNKKSITKVGAQLFGVSEETFVNWRWQMKFQVQSANDLASILKI